MVTLPSTRDRDGNRIEYDPEICPVRHVIDSIGDKWSVLVLTALKAGTMRFSELRRGIPDISQRMLTVTLRKLERDGYLTRKATPSIPPRVDYELTELGRSLVLELSALADWALSNRAPIARARAVYDAENKTA